MNPGQANTANSSVPLLTNNVARSLAVNIGFDEAGVVPLPHAHEDRDAERYTYWIQAGRAGFMHYLTRRDERGELIRSRTRIPFSWARSAVVCLANYNSAQPRSTDAAGADAGWIARYAWSSRVDERGRRVASDYHKVLLKRMRKLEARLHEQCGAFESRAFVDTGPVVERALATAAGLGWTAKNTCLIHPRMGSYVFLAVLLTSLEVSESASQQVSESASERVSESSVLVTSKGSSLEVPDRCGSCTRCIESCPTDALSTPYQMDATKCISYLTIEHRGEIRPELMDRMGRQVFGCDICQDVCPWNRRAPIAGDAELTPRRELVNPALEWLSWLEESEWEELFNGSPVRRAGFAGFRRNVAIAVGNAGDPRLAARLHEWTRAADAGLRAAATWAVGKIERLGRTAENR